ncbi:hypothetical protein [Geothrix sp. PMB-07]|uniref:hypothetical protein n=1 Tax=Geothrix sp. PMB-07 TaxID=3068640 RepID=UPI0027414596|nr:hypothetical protein [Geothrix sp. PMB-07]WLT31700.1 hypothetical protein Q9293_18510 [Geothrix sp. PMB-07]
MLTEVITLLIQLPPLAFGPALPPGPFNMPKALVCDIHDLGRIHPAKASSLEPLQGPSRLKPRAFRPDPHPFLVNKPVDALLFLAVAYAGRATWDETPWSARTWQATGAVAPVVAPPGVPPVQGSEPR